MRVLVLLAAALLVAAPATRSGGPDDPLSVSTSAVAPLGSDLAAIEATLALPFATFLNDRDGNKVFDSLDERLPLGPQPVIVTFVAGTDVPTALAKALTVAAPLSPRYVYHQYGGFAADMDLQQVLAVAALPEVRQVEWSQPGHPELDTATRTMNVRTVQEQLGITGDGNGTILGKGSLIAVLDTGFDGQHVDLQGKFVRFIDWSDGGAEKEPYDAGNHGTHVASIAAGLGVGNPGYRGVAPGADLVGFLISSQDTKGAAIASIDYLLEHREELPVDVLTISFGFGTTVDGTDALELAMDKAWAAGITTFKSTGNSGPNRGTVTIPGGARGIIGTASMFDAGEGGFRLSSFSSRGPTADGRIKPDIAAPGSLIMAALAGTGNGYASFSGTSMASPFAAGVAALMKSVDPALTPDDVRRILAQTAEDWGPPGHDIDYGHGRLDALRAIQQVAYERHLRGEVVADEVRAVNVTGEPVPFHAHGRIGGSGAATFLVEDVGHWLAVTFLANHSFDAPGGVRMNAFAAVVRDPDGLVLAQVQPGAPGTTPTYRFGADPNTARQQTVSLPVTKTGMYTIQVLPGMHSEVLWDVSAGLPPVALPAVIGELIEQEPLQDDATQAPGLGAWAALGLLLLAAVRRR